MPANGFTSRFVEDPCVTCARPTSSSRRSTRLLEVADGRIQEPMRGSRCAGVAFGQSFSSTSTSSVRRAWLLGMSRRAGTLLDADWPKCDPSACTWPDASLKLSGLRGLNRFPDGAGMVLITQSTVLSCRTA